MDAIFSFCMNMAAWHWLSLGVALLSFELMFPGVFMLWFGVGAILTSIFAYILGVSGIVAIIIFLVLGLAACFFSQRFSNKEAKFLVNNAHSKLIGKTIILEDAIRNGQARAKIGDGHWTLTGPDLPAGTKVKVTDVSGNSLVVEQA